MRIRAHSISNGILTAGITNFGASLMDLRLKGVDRALILGYPNAEDYVNDGQFMGAVIGRCANRIGGGIVPWGADKFTLERNENDANHLHGGTKGFGQQVWQVHESTPTSITLEHHSPDGHAGYPGNLKATAIYEMDGATLRLQLHARCDKDTVVNLCHHPYFNLDGHEDICRHLVSIDAAHYLPVHENLLPTGEIAPVADTDFDVREPTTVSKQFVNNTYCLHEDQTGQLAHAASIKAGSVRMDLYTTQPGVHYYNGYKLKPKAVGIHGRSYDAYAGLCLEAQAWPDSSNNANFPDVTLKAGQRYLQVTEYRFGSVRRKAHRQLKAR